MVLHDIWNPWHGCIKVSEGCANCYMYYLDKTRSGKDGSQIYRTGSGFNYPLQKDKHGNYKIKSGDTLSEIAVKHKTTVKKIMELNPSIENANRIKAGATIKLPK